MRSVATWVSIEVLACTVPLLLAWTVGTGEPETFWSNLLVITGSQAATTLVVAALFASRFKVITQNIGIDAAISIHRVLGSTAVIFIFIHLIAVVTDYPINVWLVDIFQSPARSLAGLTALIILLLMVFYANEKKQRYEVWRWAHRGSALLAALFITWHIAGVNQLVNSTPWLLFFLTLACSTLALFISRLVRSRGHDKFFVNNIYMESSTASTMCLRPITRTFKFSAGQFAWVRLSRGLKSEDHPFTIASSEHDSTVRITFRHNGDWTTNHLAGIRPGKIVRLDGPHGAMSLSHVPPQRDLALIALGVGLTPVMSILRTLADEEDQRSIAVFISPTENLFVSEFEGLKSRLVNMKLFPVLTRPITRATFTRTIESPLEWFYIVCGPPSMVRDTKAALLDMFVPESRVLTEQFEII